MRKRVRLGAVSMRDLSRNPAAVLKRVQSGERLVVCCHRRPVATLQPLDGCVVQPFTAREYDVEGSVLGDASQEAGKLEELHREILVYGQRGDRFSPGNVSRKWSGEERLRAIDDLALRGLIYKTERGWRLTGRGWMLREALAGHETFAPKVEWQGSKWTRAALQRSATWRLEKPQS